MSSSSYDVAIVGGGIIGLATALRLTRRYPRCKVAVVEKEPELATHQTGHNSGVIHSGIYYRPGSRKAQFCVQGVASMVRFCDENGVDYQRCGKVIVATDESELGRMEDLYQRGVANGVPGLEKIGSDRLREIEPNARGVAALHAPGTGIVDFRKVAGVYADQVRSAGAEIMTGRRVVGISVRTGAVRLETTQGGLESRYLINCAGLHADRVARMMGVDPGIRIIPFRGEYYTIRKDRRDLVKALIYPVPNPRFPFLGVHFTRSIHGDVEAGPNAVLALAREGYTKATVSLGDTLGALAFRGFWAMALKTWKTGLGEMHRSFSKRVFLHDLQRLLPGIRAEDLAPGGSGVRAQAVDRDGRLLDDFSIHRSQGAIHVLNAPSPGATSSLAIGEHIVGLAAESFDLETSTA
jgi:L-2-hydroxyglutarate oxidase LhgO